jgi:hypothetical protein
MIVTTQPKISLSLDAADTTIMHRVGMTGLYMTLKRLEKQYSSSRQRGGNISWSLTADTIELFWEGNDFVALSWLIQESFQLDDTGLIHLAGLDNNTIDLSQKIHIHEGMCAVFLRHNKFYQAGGLVKTELEVEEKKVEYMKRWKEFYKAKGGFDYFGIDMDDPKIAFGYLKIGQIESISDRSIPITLDELNEFRDKLVNTQIINWNIKGA